VPVFRNDQIPGLLGLLNKTLYFLKRTGGDPEKSLGHYITKFFDGITLDSIFSELLKTKNLLSMPLKYISALYYLAEDIISERVMENIPQSFKVPIPKEVTKQFTILETPIVCHVLLTCLKRFAYRYLTGGHVRDLESHARSLCDILVDRTLWPFLPIEKDYEEIEKVLLMLPTSLKVSHIFEIYTYFINWKHQQPKQITRQTTQRTDKKTNPLLTHL